MSEVTTQEPMNPMIAFKRDLTAFTGKELGFLDDKTRERMKSAAIVAVTKDPDLLLADRQSFMSELRRCADYGVIPDGVQAVLQVYNTKIKLPSGEEKWIKKVTLLPMIRGIIERVQRSGKVKIFYAEVVYDGEAFRIDQTHGDRRPAHEFDPMRRGADKDIIGAYSVAVYKDGTTDCEVMPRDQIMKVRAVAKTKNVWDGWLPEKAKVAVMKRHSKRLPLSADDLEFILNRDETDFTQMKDVTPEDRPNLAQHIARQPTAAPERPEDGDTIDGQAQDAPAAQPALSDEEIERDAFPGSDAFTHGADAFNDGKPETDCPYDLSEARQEAVDWCGGWRQARRAKE